MLTFLLACIPTPQPSIDPSPDGTLSSGEPTPTSPTTPKQGRWTVAVWMDGDNNLERYIDDDLDELERAKVDGINIAVQVDRIDGYSSGGGDWTGTRRYEIVEDTIPGPESVLAQDMGEIDMGDGAALADFLAWTNERYPADHFALVLWNHGGGFWIASDDTSSGHSRIYLHDGELNDALAGLVEARGERIDLVAFDACNMGEWEVAATLQDQVQVMTASQAWVGGGGYAYDAVFPTLPDDADAIALGDKLAYSAGVINEELTHAAINLALLPDVSDAVDQLAGALLADPEGLETFVRARADTRGLDQQWEEFWLDLGGFADRAVLSETSDVSLAAQHLRDVLDASIIGNYRSAPLSFASGLTIMAETSNPSWFERYGMGAWSDTRWDELLEAVAEAEQSQ